ncbi:outer membrane protein transport protein [Gilvimarinus sp. SDUM040013]|uniref:Outer membrane protein transport protein n=1 Tax=Gilvimarinus gilvus TaxID=3058038 RepID=A0ABU4S265_9GAMM|nr:outer membrane protein transport protein [Gilvimarinus sp. SDUM040013]MDO3385486.1 outer membrane protein transport protein [Gilvimarinus sp. SDUM040013]MDX6851279.1 outer membrane protein transport protein [Gilvimarinus sp. SDUM040013]
MNNKVKKLSIVGALVATSSVAHGASFQLLEQSPAQLGKAFAGTASDITDATTVFFNPAGMSKLNATSVAVGFNVVSTDATFNDNGSTFSGGDGTTEEFGFIPNLYAAIPLTETLAVGVGISAPFGLASRFDEEWAGRYSATDSELEVVNFNVTTSWAPNDKFAIGLGLNYQTVEATLENQVDSTLGVLPATATDSSAKIKGDDDGFVLDASVLITPSENTSIGLLWREGGDYKLQGDASFDLNAACAPGAGYPTGAPPAPTTGTLCAGALGALAGDIEAEVELPDTLTLSLSQRFTPAFAMHLDVSQTDWSSIKTVAVVKADNGAPVDALNLQYGDTTRYALGATLGVPGQFNWRFGVAQDETPQDNPEFVSARIPDADRTWLAAGFHWPLSNSMSVDVSYAYLMVDDAELHESEVTPVGSSAVLSGSFDSSVNILAAQFNWKF